MTTKLKELRAIAEKATPGNWKFMGLVGGSGAQFITNDDGRSIAVDCVYKRDGEFVAAFQPKAALALLGSLTLAMEALDFYADDSVKITKSKQKEFGVTWDVTTRTDGALRREWDEGKRARQAISKIEKALGKI